MKLFAKMLAACLLLCFTAFAGTAEIAPEKNEGRAARVLCQSDGRFRNETGNFTARNRYTSSEIDRIQALVGQFTIQSVAETADGIDIGLSDKGQKTVVLSEIARMGIDTDGISFHEEAPLHLNDWAIGYAFEAGLANADGEYGPFIDALICAVGADAEASEPGFDPEACFERWGMDVNKIRERELSLRFNGYDARLITEYVRASMAESSDEEVRRRAEDLPEMLNPACTAVP